MNRYQEFYGISQVFDNIYQVLEFVAKKYNLEYQDTSIMRYNQNEQEMKYNLQEAARRFVFDFRLGHLGNMTLDNCSPDALELWFNQGTAEGEEGIDHITHTNSSKRKIII